MLEQNLLHSQNDAYSRPSRIIPPLYVSTLERFSNLKVTEGRHGTITRPLPPYLDHRRQIDRTVSDIVAAIKSSQPGDISLVYSLTERLQSILCLQRLYITTCKPSLADEIVSHAVLRDILLLLGDGGFHVWTTNDRSYSVLLCQELLLRTLIDTLRILRCHGITNIEREVLDVETLMSSLPFGPSISHQKSHEVHNWNLDFLLLYLRNFLDVLPQADISSSDIATKAFNGIFPTPLEKQLTFLQDNDHLDSFDKQVRSNNTDIHDLYIVLDDLLFHLMEWQKQKKFGLKQGLEEHKADQNTIEEISSSFLSNLSSLVDHHLDVLDSGDFEVVNFPEDSANGLLDESPSCSLANHIIYGVLDLFHQFVHQFGAEAESRKIYKTTMRVVKVAKSSSIRCKAIDVLTVLVHEGLITAFELDSEIKSFKINSELYLELLEQRDRSNAIYLTKRQLDEQSYVQQNSFQFGQLPTPIEAVEPRNGIKHDSPASFESLTDMDHQGTKQDDDWRDFLWCLEQELVGDGQTDMHPSDDLGMMSCGCILSEGFAAKELEFTNLCPSCGYPTEFKKPLEKLRRLCRLVAQKKQELGVETPLPAPVDSQSLSIKDAESIETSSIQESVGPRLPITGGAAIPQDNMVFGSPSQGGGFPKEMLWENPSIKYTPDTLQQLFGDQVNKSIQTFFDPISRHGSINSTLNQEFVSKRLQASSTTEQEIFSSSLDYNSTREDNAASHKGEAKSAQGSGSAWKPSSDRSQTFPNSKSKDPARSLSPSRAIPAASPKRHSSTASRMGPFDGSGIISIPFTTHPYFGSTAPRNGGTKNTSPEASKQDLSIYTSGSSRQRGLSGSQMSSSFGSSMSGKTGQTFLIDDEPPKSVRTPIESNNRITNWPTPASAVSQDSSLLDKEEERRYNNFARNFPWQKGEYVHHIQTGSRLRFNDVIATSIARNCSKLVLLEKKKFKVYSILASDKMPELLCCGKSTGEYGSYADPYGNQSAEDKVTGKQSKWEYLMAECSERFLAIAGTQGTLRVHNIVHDGQPIYTYVSDVYDIRCMALSPNGQIVAVGVVTSEYGREVSQIILHYIDPKPNAKPFEPIRVTLPYPDPTGTLSFSHDGTYLTCSTVREPRFLVYDLALRGQPPKLIQKSTRKIDISHDAEGITSVRFFPDNRLLCVTSVATGAPPIIVDSNVGIVDPATSLPVRQMNGVARMKQLGDKVYDCCVSPTGQSLCVLDRSGNVIIVHFPQGVINDEGRFRKIVKVAKVQGATKLSEAASIAFSPEGHRLIIVDRKADVTIVDFAEGDEKKLTQCVQWD